MTQALELVKEIDRIAHPDGPQGLIYALADMPDRARESLNGAEANNWNVFSMVRLAVLLGEQERALDLLEQESIEHPEDLLFMRCFQETRSLEGQPRYQQVLERIGFPD